VLAYYLKPKDDPERAEISEAVKDAVAGKTVELS
jgi:hypothetical protein